MIDMACFTASPIRYNINCSLIAVSTSKDEAVLVDYGDCTNKLFTMKDRNP